MVMKIVTVLDSVKKLACMFGDMFNGALIATKRLKSRMGCCFQIQGLDSIDDDERWDSI